eukprot:scaffold3819_cov107-Isochrysis_galbana.AAC.5
MILRPAIQRASPAEGHGEAMQHAVVMGLLHVAAKLANCATLHDSQEEFEDGQQMCRLARGDTRSRCRGERLLLAEEQLNALSLCKCLAIAFHQFPPRPRVAARSAALLRLASAAPLALRPTHAPVLAPPGPLADGHGRDGLGRRCARGQRTLQFREQLAVGCVGGGRLRLADEHARVEGRLPIRRRPGVHRPIDETVIDRRHHKLLSGVGRLCDRRIAKRVDPARQHQHEGGIELKSAPGGLEPREGADRAEGCVGVGKGGAVGGGAVVRVERGRAALEPHAQPRAQHRVHSTADCGVHPGAADALVPE